jgi:hypothetical protein
MKDELKEIERFYDRYGEEKLLRAIRKTGDYLRGDLTRRGAAERLDIDAIEGIRITKATERWYHLFVAADVVDDDIDIRDIELDEDEEID